MGSSRLLSFCCFMSGLVILSAFRPHSVLTHQWAAGRRVAGGRSAVRASAAAGVDVSGGNGGVLKYMVKEGRGGQLGEGAVAVLRYQMRAAGRENDAQLAASASFQTTIGDGTMVRGWDTALLSMRVGEAARFVCSSEYGWGEQGVPPFVSPGESIELDVEVLDLRGNVFQTSTMADDAPLTPRTAGEIKKEFERRQAERGGPNDKEGMERYKDRFDPRKIYIFGFFDSETGEEAPWYLRPLLTFPLMVIGSIVPYLILVQAGAITIRGDAPMIPGSEIFRLLPL